MQRTAFIISIILINSINTSNRSSSSLEKTQNKLKEAFQNLYKRYNLLTDYKQFKKRSQSFSFDQTLIRTHVLENKFPKLNSQMCGNSRCATMMYEVTNQSSGPDVINNLPTIVLIGGFNGKDRLGITILEDLLELLSKIYISEKEWFIILNNVRLLVIPVINTLGFYSHSEFETRAKNSRGEKIESLYDFNLKPKGYCYEGFVSQMLNQLHSSYLIMGGLVLSQGKNAIMYPDVQKLLLHHQKSPDKFAFEQVALKLKGLFI